MQEVSVIIPNFNGMAYLDGVLAGLECQSVNNFEVILVDNGSSDGSCAFVAARYPWVHLIELPENFGFCKAVNEGIEVSILADTVLHSFSETVKNKNEAIYAALNDSVSDTIYRLCLSDDSCIGTGFAKLCGQGSNSRWVELGCESYQTYRDFSAALVKKFVFKK